VNTFVPCCTGVICGMFHILHSYIRIDFHINRLAITNIILVI